MASAEVVVPVVVPGLVVPGLVVSGLVVPGFVVPGLVVSGLVVPGLVVPGVVVVGSGHSDMRSETFIHAPGCPFTLVMLMAPGTDLYMKYSPAPYILTASFPLIAFSASM